MIDFKNKKERGIKWWYYLCDKTLVPIVLKSKLKKNKFI